MGYAMAIEIVKKFEPSITPTMIDVISTTIDYGKNDWAKKNFDTTEAYIKYTLGDSAPNVAIAPAVLDYYKKWIDDHPEDYGSIWHSVFDACSSASELQKDLDIFFKVEHRNADAFYIKDKTCLLEAKKWAFEKLVQYEPTAAKVEYAFRTIEDEDEGYISYKQIACDGIDVTVNNVQKRIFNEWDELYTVLDYDKYWLFSHLYIGLSILCELDLDNYIVRYVRGW